MQTCVDVDIWGVALNISWERRHGARLSTVAHIRERDRPQSCVWESWERRHPGGIETWGHRHGSATVHSRPYKGARPATVVCLGILGTAILAASKPGGTAIPGAIPGGIESWARRGAPQGLACFQPASINGCGSAAQPPPKLLF